MANLWLSYRLQSGKAKGLGFGAGANYSGKNILINSTSQGQFTAPAYTLVNATVFYDRPYYRLALKVDNLTNQHYWIGWDTVNPQALRSVTGTLAFKF
jgi:iron complex outermembrane receptor protein